MNLVDVVVGRGTVVAGVLALAVTSWQALPARHADHPRVVVTDTETTILDVIEFAPGTATLRATSRPTLDAVAETLRGNPSIERVEVQSHTSGLGDHCANQRLSDQRAAVVMKYLVDAGIEPSRLVAQGYGDAQPIDITSPVKNERVAFLILQRAP